MSDTSKGELSRDYPTLARLADPANTTIGYQHHDLVREAVTAYRELAGYRAGAAEREQAAEAGDWSDGPLNKAPTVIGNLPAVARQEPAADTAALIRTLADLANEAVAVRRPGLAHTLREAIDMIAALAAQAAAAERYWPYVEAVAKQRFPFSHADIIDAVEMLRERKKAAIAASAPPSAEKEGS